MYRRSLLFVALSSIAYAESPLMGNRVVATVNGEPVTAAQLEAATRPELESLDQRVRQIRQAALMKLIDNALLDQAARSQGVTIDAYLAAHVESVQVSAGAVEQAYNRSADHFPGVLPAEAKYRIRRTLEDNARAAALRSLLERLRANARIMNQLEIDSKAALVASAQEGPFRGPATAPVTILEFSDFECPYCRAAQPVVKQVLDRWPGQVRLVFKHFPLDQHTNAMSAAKAAACAERQGRFWAVHDLLFEITDGLSDERIHSAAGRAGLDTAALDNCMAAPDTADQVRRDMVTGRVAGVTGTPAFFVNGEAVSSPAALFAAVESNLRNGK